jgi:CRP-like cAMP-binding protein
MNETRLDIPQILSRLPLFQELAPAQLAVLEPACRERRLSKGAMLFQKGDPAKGFFVLVFGQIKLAFPSAQGNEKVVQIVGPRQSFGEAVMFLDLPCPVFAEALVDSLLLHIGSGPVFELLETDPLFARRMLAGPVDATAFPGTGCRNLFPAVVGAAGRRLPSAALPPKRRGMRGLVRHLAADFEASHRLAPQPDAGNPVADISRSRGQWFDRGERQADHHQQRKTFARI